jgi:hypothetical protein
MGSNIWKILLFLNFQIQIFKNFDFEIYFFEFRTPLKKIIIVTLDTYNFNFEIVLF